MADKIPETLQEAHDYLDTLQGREDFIQRGPIAFHFGLGRWMRNNWGLWTKEGKLYEWFASLGVEHADDMSGIILRSYYAKQTGDSFDLDAEVEKIKNYWGK